MPGGSPSGGGLPFGAGDEEELVSIGACLSDYQRLAVVRAASEASASARRRRRDGGACGKGPVMATLPDRWRLREIGQMGY